MKKKRLRLSNQMNDIISDMRLLTHRLAASGIKVDLRTFPSGAATLDVWQDSRFFVMAYTPSWQGFGVDDVLDGEGFLEKYDFFSHDFAPAAGQLLLLLGFPQYE